MNVLNQDAAEKLVNDVETTICDGSPEIPLGNEGYG